MYRYRFTGDEPMAFVTIQKNGYPGEVIESSRRLNHPLLELITDKPVVEEVEELTESAVVPETYESPVSGDEPKEN